MTYEAVETSAFGGEPIELYTFTVGNTNWRYTNGDSDLTVNSLLFEGVNIKRKNIQVTQDISRAPQNISIQGDVELLKPYSQAPQGEVAEVKIERMHRSDSEVIVLWVGRMTNVKFINDAMEAILRCEPAHTAVLRNTMRMVFQSGCPHVLYGNSCRVVEASYEELATLDSVSSVTLTSPDFAGFATGYFGGGFITYTELGVVQTRFISDHITNTITITFPFINIPSTAAVKVYPGCDHSLKTCILKFGNEDNYGGQPYYPKKNPFSFNPVF